MEDTIYSTVIFRKEFDSDEEFRKVVNEDYEYLRRKYPESKIIERKEPAGIRLSVSRTRKDEGKNEVCKKILLYEEFITREFFERALKSEVAYMKARYPLCEIAIKKTRKGAVIIVYQNE